LVLGDYGDGGPTYMEGRPGETLDAVAADIAIDGYMPKRILGVVRVQPGHMTADVTEQVRNMLIDRIIDGYYVGDRARELLKNDSESNVVSFRVA
jgi:hypothetical protein